MTLKSGLRVTQGHRNRHVSIRHLWLPVNIPYQAMAYLVPFPRQTEFSRKSPNFTTYLRVFCATAEGVPLGIGYRRCRGSV